MSININRNVEDTFYRYKMPKLLAKVEGKGNGIKTVIANMIDIGKALNRPPTYPTKYFGCELGAQTQFDNKNDRYIVNGDHDAAKLQDLLDGFIRKFVLCQECDNPETTLVVKGQKITLNCKACGHVTSVDPRHRLTTFVVKNPPADCLPDNDNGAAGKKIGKGSKSKSAGAAKEIANGHSTSVDNGSTEHPNGVDLNSPVAEDGDDGDWAVDPENVEDRQRQLVGNMANITMNDDLEKSVDERLIMFMGFVKKGLFKAMQPDVKLIQVEAERLDIKDEAIMVLCRTIFEDNPSLLTCQETIAKYRPLFLRFSQGNERAQRHLLGALEQILVHSYKKDKAAHDSLLIKTPRILELLYDADILEEKQILKWAEKTSSKYVTREENKEVRSKATAFINWLKEAEEESGEESDDELEIVYDTKVPNSKTATSRVTPAASVVNGKDEEELDIDNI